METSMLKINFFLPRDQLESETNTEKFEKVCGSISDETYSPLLEGGDFVDSTYHDVDVEVKPREELQDEDKALEDLRKNSEENHTLALPVLQENIKPIKIAVQFSNRLDVKEKIFCILIYGYENLKEWQKTLPEKAIDAIKELSLSEEAKQLIIGTIESIVLRILSWAKYCEHIFALSYDDSVGFLNDTFFTEEGIIDSEKVAKEIKKLVDDENLPINIRYKLACTYCLTESIPALWKQVLKKEIFHNAENPYQINQPELVKFWSYYLSDNINKLKGEKSIPRYIFEAAIKDGSELAVRWLWQKLGREKKNVVEFAMQTLEHKDNSKYEHIPKFVVAYIGSPWFPVEYYNDILSFLLSQMNEEQKKEFFKKDVKAVKYSRVLYCFLEWPYQCYFIEAAKLMWEVLPNSNYAKLLRNISDRCLDEGNYYCWADRGENDYDYYKLFKEFWSQSSNVYKRYILSDEQDHVTLNKLLVKLFGVMSLTSSIDEKSVELIKLILNDATPREKENITTFYRWRDTCDKLIVQEKWELLEELIKMSTSSVEQANLFKREFVSLFGQYNYLVDQGNFALMDKIKRWGLKSEEEIIESKKKLIFIDNSQWKCKNLMIKGNVELFDRFVNWGLKSEEDIKEFKKELVYNYGLEISREILSEDSYHRSYTVGNRIDFEGDKWEQIEMFLTWAFSSEKEIDDFKKNELFKFSAAAIYENLILANKWEEAEIFFDWLMLSEQEIKEFKKKYLFCSELFREMIFFEEEENFFLPFGGKREAIFLFLRFNLTDRETILEFQNTFKRRFNFSGLTEGNEAPSMDFNLQIERCLKDLAEEERERKVEALAKIGRKRKVEALDSPRKK